MFGAVEAGRSLGVDSGGRGVKANEKKDKSSTDKGGDLIAHCGVDMLSAAILHSDNNEALYFDDLPAVKRLTFDELRWKDDVRRR